MSPGAPLRVLIVCGRLDPERDGVGDYVVRLARALTASGATVRIGHTGDDAGVGGAVRFGRTWGPRALVRAARAARGADVVHVQFAPSMYGFRIGVGLLPLLLGRRPVVTTVHEYGWWRWERLLPPRVWRLLERARVADRETARLVPASRAVITTNAAHTGTVASRFGPRPSTVTIPIGANVEAVPDLDRRLARAAVREELGLAPGAVLLAFFGFVHPVKGLRHLGDAVAALRAEGRDVHAMLIGGFDSLALPGEEATSFERELRADLAAAGVADQVRITGFRDAADVSRLLAAADGGVLPFTHGVTAKSGSLLTLLTHRLPTVVTAGDEPEPELVDGDRVAVVPEVRSGAALAAGLRRVLDDEAFAAGLADRGAAWARTRDWDAIAAAHLELYAEVA